MYGAVFSLLASFEYGRSVLLAHPELFSAGVFSHAGPSQEQLDGTSFSVRFFGCGFKDESSIEKGARALCVRGES